MSLLKTIEFPLYSPSSRENLEDKHCCAEAKCLPIGKTEDRNCEFTSTHISEDVEVDEVNHMGEGNLATQYSTYKNQPPIAKYKPNSVRVH